MVVGRVSEDEVEGGRGGAKGCVGGRIGRNGCGVTIGDMSNEGSDGRLDDFGVDKAIGGEDGAEVLAENADDGGGLFDENRTGGAAAQGFEAKGAGAGVGVENRGVGEIRLEHVEEGELFAGAHGVSGGAGGGGEGAALVGAGEDVKGSGVRRLSGHGERWA